MVHGREINGQVEEFGVSGYVYKNVFIIYDRKTESLWWPLDDTQWTAVSGPRKGETIPILEEVPLVTLREWREKHPDTLVLIGSKSKIEGSKPFAKTSTVDDSVSHGSNRRPNIIFIMVDDLGYGDLGCYGQREIATPNLDRLAAEGMRFTDFYAGSTVCAPSRCVLMTGLHTGHAYIRGNGEVKPMGQRPLLPDASTVARMLQKTGYSTGLVGKWGLGGPGSTGIPGAQGFDYFYGYLCQRHAHNYYPEFLFRNTVREPLEGNHVEKPRTDGAGVATERAQYSHDLMVKEALAFLDRQAANSEKSPIPEKSRGNKQPFFLYLALTIPHANNEAGEQGMEVPDKGSYKDQPWPDPERGLAAMISRMDQDVGRLMKKLKQLGIDDRTIVFFTSDNGPHNEGGHDASFFHSSGPLRGSKRDLYEGGIRVPMIVRWPGKIEPRSESAHLSYLGDFFATAADLAGTEPPPELDSISLAPTLWGDASEQKQHPYLYWEFYERGSSQAARQGKWKVVRQPMLTGNVELYDLSQDIGEHHDVAAKYHDVAVRMASTLDEAHVASPLWKLPSKPKSVLKAE